MSQQSSIEWTDHTFNPWWGCTKVSSGCTNCYAETLANRYGHTVWGPRAERRLFGEKHWQEPLKWNRLAQEAGVPARVFCASMADVFEDNRKLDEERIKLWGLIADTPWLHWQLLTKRPEHVLQLAPWVNEWPKNVWLGTSVENQAAADYRVPLLQAIPAHIRFLSCEPLLGPIEHLDLQDIDWVIAGGESGMRHRPIDIEWIRSLRNRCVTSDVAFFFKQWGGIRSKTGGRLLDGREWSEFPHVDLPDAITIA